MQVNAMIIHNAAPCRVSRKPCDDGRRVDIDVSVNDFYGGHIPVKVNLLQQQQLHGFGDLKTIYVDAARTDEDQPSDCTIKFSNGQTIVVAAFHQGYFAVYDPAVTSLEITCFGTVRVSLFDFVLPVDEWDTLSRPVMYATTVLQVANTGKLFIQNSCVIRSIYIQAVAFHCSNLILNLQDIYQKNLWPSPYQPWNISTAFTGTLIDLKDCALYSEGSTNFNTTGGTWSGGYLIITVGYIMKAT